MVDISVIMPAYNTEKYIGQCLNSVLDQTLQNIEIIVVDDGSQDNTVDVIEKIMLKDSRVRLIKQQNRFAGVARNNGLCEAEGEYVIFLDSDDFFEKNMFELMLNRIRLNDADICICGACEYDNSTGMKSACDEYLKMEYLPDTDVFSARDIASSIFRFTCDAPWNKLYKKSFIDEHKLSFQEVKRANDTRFVNMSLALAERITIVPQVLVNYRVNHGGNLQSTYVDRPFTFYDTMKSFLAELKEHGVYETFRQSYVNKATGLTLNGLDRMKTYPGYRDIVRGIKSGMAKELEITGFDKAYYYNYYDFKQLYRVIHYPIWVVYSMRELGKKMAEGK